MLGPTKAHFILHELIPTTPLFGITRLNSRLFQNIFFLKKNKEKCKNCLPKKMTTYVIEKWIFAT